jgi:hypothetical protein
LENTVALCSLSFKLMCCNLSSQGSAWAIVTCCLQRLALWALCKSYQEWTHRHELSLCPFLSSSNQMIQIQKGHLIYFDNNIWIHLLYFFMHHCHTKYSASSTESLCSNFAICECGEWDQVFCVKRMHMFLLLLNCSWIIRHASVLFSHHSQVDLKAVFLNFNDGSQEPALNVFDGACTTRMDPVSISVDVVANKAIWCFHFIDFDYHLFPIGTVTKALHWFQTPEQCNYWWNRLIIACISKNTTSMR